jgi:phosphopantothenoylcysteine decarboxylase/phosphopantothenate--cysteine ligase
MEFICVRSSEEMQRAVLSCLDRVSVVIQAAAVADYRPTSPQKQKIKRSIGKLTLELELTPDIVAEIVKKKASQTVVGFAAETENLVANARKKLVEKKLDLIVANDVTQDGAGFDSDTNIVTLVARDHRLTELPKADKFGIANRILDEVLRLRDASP